MTKTPLDKALLVFARHLVDEMRYINYPKEWSRPPLSDLLSQLYDVLNYHPDRLGDIVHMGYKRTFPEVKRGNLTQLAGGTDESTQNRYLFGKTRQYYLDEYEVSRSDRKIEAVKNDELAQMLDELFEMIVQTFASLTSDQENEHRTLERICFAIEPVYAQVQGMKDVGWDLAEYADFWRKLSTDERKTLASKLLQ